MSLTEGYEKIYNTFGQEQQIEKLCEEIEEFIVAVETGSHKDRTEECADVMVVLNQFVQFCGLNKQSVVVVMTEKVDRTLERIESGYYDKGVGV
jgi:phosphoribosyl-ATP pyrophosphohydrolase